MSVSLERLIRVSRQEEEMKFCEICDENEAKYTRHLEDITIDACSSCYDVLLPRKPENRKKIKWSKIIPGVVVLLFFVGTIFLIVLEPNPRTDLWCSLAIVNAFLISGAAGWFGIALSN